MASALQRLPESRPSDTLAVQAERVAALYAPAYVVLDHADDVVLFSGGTGPFLDPAGNTTLHLPSLVHRDVAAVLRSVLRRVRETGRASHAHGLVVTTATGVSRLSLAVEPLPAEDGLPDRLMVLFRDEGAEPVWPQPAASAHSERLESALRVTRDRLHAATHELAVSNEEHQSSTEELATSNEELEATSEDLRLANDALLARVGELNRANVDIRHMLQSTRIAIVFLDGALRIRSFTPAVCGVFHLIGPDVGRPITDIAAQVDYPELAADVRQVLLTQDVLEREVDSLDHARRYLARVLPYRDDVQPKAGVVLAFLEITALHQATLARRESEERLHRMAASVPAFLFIAGRDRGWDYVNPPFYAFTAMAAGAAFGQAWLAAIHPEDAALACQAWQLASDTGSVLEHEIRFRRADGAWCWFLLRAVPQIDAGGTVTRWFGSCTDIDQRRLVEARQGAMLAELQHRVKNILVVVRSVLTRTLESSTDLDHFAHHFAGRLGALARSQTAAARTPQRLVMLGELVAEELVSHGGQDERQTYIDGPEVALSEKMAGSIGLAVHELTTNALKYGGLSVPTGHVEVRWQLEPLNAANASATERLTLDWEEKGVPVTDLRPRRRGFGRELIEQGLPYELGAVTTLEFRPGGMRCRIVVERPTLPASMAE